MLDLQQKKRPRVPSPPVSGSSSDSDVRNPCKPKKKAKAADYVDVYGPQAKPRVEITKSGPIKISDVQALLLWVLADGVMPTWAFVQHKPLIQRVVLVAVPGIDASCFSANAELLPNMHSLLGTPITVWAKSHHCHYMEAVQALFSVPRDKKRRRDEVLAAASAVTPASNGTWTEDMQVHPDHPIDSYIMSPEQLRAHGFRVQPADSHPTEPVPPGFVSTLSQGTAVAVSSATQPSSAAANHAANGDSHSATANSSLRHHDSCQTESVAANGAHVASGAERDSADGSSSSSSNGEGTDHESAQNSRRNGVGLHTQRDLVALDCEMCFCGSDNLEVTRLSLVGSHGEVLMDELVVPDSPITDYNTRYSGITASMMADAEMSLSAARAALLQYLGPQTILVGHALENDLEKLRVVHDRIIDTGSLYPHPKGPPYKQSLKYLTQRHLNRSIQGGQHDSVEDARAALQLAALKFRHGPEWGCGTAGSGSYDPLMSVLAEAGCRATLVDRAQFLKQHTTGTADAIKVDSDGKAATAAQRALCRAGSSRSFVWTSFTSLANLYERRAKALTPKGGIIQHARLHDSKSLPVTTSAAETAITLQHPAATILRQAHCVSESQTGQAVCDRTELLRSPSLSPGRAHETQCETEHAISLPIRYGQADAATLDVSEQEVAILADLDRFVGKLHAAAPDNTLLLVYTVQGDTPECRRQQQQKWRRQQNPPLDEQLPWDANGEEAMFSALSARVSRALCFATVKGA